MPAEAERKPLYRLANFCPCVNTPLPVRLLARIKRRLGICHKLHYRTYQNYFGDLTPYAGDQWWALSRAACQHIEAFIEQQPKLVDFFKNTAFPDEMFFQIILGNSSFLPNIRRNVTYADWRIEGSHPARISEQHLDDLFSLDLSFKPEDWYGAGEMLFARKFQDADASLVDSVDRRILERDPPGDGQHEKSA